MWYSQFLREGDDTPLRLLVIQPTPFCNIDCKYCYLPNRSHKAKISLSTIERLLGRLLEDSLIGADLTVLWHAGEPLTLPVTFYEEAYALFRTTIGSRCNFLFNFQTNGTLISEQFCDFAKRTHSQVGISIDGPEFITDRWRVTRSGEGVFAKVQEGLRRLRRHAVPFGTICVLTADSLTYANEIYEFFRDLGANSVGFNVEEIEGTHRSSTLRMNGACRSSVQAFVERIYARLRTEKPAVRFREFDQIGRAIKFGTTSFSRLNNPLAIISVDHAGNFSTFSPELLQNPNFIFGNISTSPFREIVDNESFRREYAAIEAGRMKCQSECGYFAVCGGGCPSNKISEHGDAATTETLQCVLSRQVYVDVILKQLEVDFGLFGGDWTTVVPAMDARMSIQ